MPALATKINPRSEEFKACAAAMRALVDDLNARLARIAQGGGDGGARQAHSRAASCSRATASSHACSTPARPSWSWRQMAALRHVCQRRAERRRDRRHRPRAAASNA
jgi:hypothetical protein